MTVSTHQWATYLHWMHDCQNGDELLLVLSAVNSGWASV